MKAQLSSQPPRASCLISRDVLVRIRKERETIVWYVSSEVQIVLDRLVGEGTDPVVLPLPTTTCAKLSFLEGDLGNPRHIPSSNLEKVVNQ